MRNLRIPQVFTLILAPIKVDKDFGFEHKKNVNLANA